MQGEPIADLIRAQLRRHRMAAGLSQEEFGRRMHYSGSQISAVELGQRPVDAHYLTRADEALETGGLFMSLLEMARRDRQPVWFRPWLEAERDARQLRLYEPLLVPGVFQTENYARAVLRTDDTLPHETVDQRVTARLERQKILAGDNPPQVVAVLDERVLRQSGDGLGGVMAEQVAHLVALAELPHVHIHVIPAEAGLHIGASGPFALARSADGGWVGHLENQLGGVVVDDEDDVASLLARWEGVRNEALPRRQSVELMKEVEGHHGPQ
ncbi:helix-turn-helix transcriptional regulator [Micromonospora sp. B11E3]|uniref:helix-turn-helix domain-containing protein n=1 Tax=Micromonospora sp. B11E3 TaxID=3153562 RepID=UPI00325EB519